LSAHLFQGDRKIFRGCASLKTRLELSNNLAENSIRPVALGRRNWIHIGSQQDGPRVAAFLSVVEAAAGSKTIQRVAALTPVAWAARHTSNNL